MGTISEMTFNAMVYIFFVAFSGGMGLVFSALIGFKLFNRAKNKSAAKTTVKKRMSKGAM